MKVCHWFFYFVSNSKDTNTEKSVKARNTLLPLKVYQMLFSKGSFIYKKNAGGSQYSSISELLGFTSWLCAFPFHLHNSSWILCSLSFYVFDTVCCLSINNNLSGGNSRLPRSFPQNFRDIVLLSCSIKCYLIFIVPSHPTLTIVSELLFVLGYIRLSSSTLKYNKFIKVCLRAEHLVSIFSPEPNVPFQFPDSFSFLFFL